MVQQTEVINSTVNNLKVLNITEEGRYGGPQSRIAKVARLLRGQGVDTTVICPSIDSHILVDELNKSNVSYIAVRLHRMTLQAMHLIGYIFFFVPEVLALRNIIKKNKFDIIHCNGCWQLKGMIAARQANTGAPVVYHLNDTHTRKIIKTIFTFLARRWVDAFFPACERSKDYYLKNTPLADKPSFILPAPVDTAVFNPKLVEADARIDAFPGLKIVTVCNVHRGKGLDEMIDLCATLRTAFSGEALSFCVVGPVNKRHAAYLKEVKDTVREKQLDNFHFVGGTSNVPAALKAADIYLCVSHFESSPMAVWEAMSMGLPIVSTDVGDVKIFLEDGNCGFCVPVGDIGGMADKISTLIKDQNMRSKMGLNARKFAVQNLDLKICAQRHAQFYRQILHNKRAMK